MQTLINLKKIAAILLMICFVLPLSRCTRDVRIDVPQAAKPEAAPQSKVPSADPVYEDKYAYQNVAKVDPAAGALTIAAFFWPLLFFLFGRATFGFRAAIALNTGELILCAGSAYMIFGLTLFGTLRYGGYLAFVALAAYSAASLAQIVLRFRMRGSPAI